MADIIARMRQIVGTTGEWSGNDLTLGDGEIAIERVDALTVRARIGDGSHPFSQSPYLVGPLDQAAADARYVMQSQTFAVGGNPAANRWPRLNASGKLDPSLVNLPPALNYRGAIDPTTAPPAGTAPGDVFVVANSGTVAAAWGAPAAGQAATAGDWLIMNSSGQWQLVPMSVGTVPEAPADGKTYARLNQTWYDLSLGLNTFEVRSPGANTSLVLQAGQNGAADGAVTILRGRTADTNPFGIEWYAGGQERMLLANNGFFGIGTNAPGRLVHMAWPGSCEFVIEDTTGPADRKKWRMYTAAGGAFLGWLADDLAGALDVISVNDLGKVGIGTLPTAAKFTVAGDIATIGGGDVIISPALGGAQSAALYNDTGSLKIGVGAHIEVMTLFESGQVLVNSPTKSNAAIGASAMEVNGEVLSGGPMAALFLESRDGEIGPNINWGGWYASGGNFKLYFGGVNIGQFNWVTGAYTQLSDGALKSEVTDTAYGLDAVLSLRPVDYAVSGDPAPQTGFIAQEVKPVIPSAVVTIAQDEGEMLGLSVMPLLAALTKGVQELAARVAALEGVQPAPTAG